MTRAKPRRPGTRSGRRELPDDLPDAAEAALDELLRADVDDDEILTHAVGAAPVTVRQDDNTAVRAPRKSKAALPAPPTTQPVRKQPPPPPGHMAAYSTADDERPTRAATSAPLEDQQFVEERQLVELPMLRVAVLEDTAHLASAQKSITVAGHVVVTSAAGSAGIARVLDAVRGGTLDAVFVTLPGGESVIDAALSIEPRRPVIIACLDHVGIEAVQRSHAAGADLAISRPYDARTLAPLLLAVSRLTTERQVTLAARGAEQVLRSRLDDLADPEPRGLLPFEMFQRVLELEIKRAKRFGYPLSVALFAVEIAPPPPPAGILGILRARAGNALIHTIRDIDIATQLDHERFLVLLPYTDLKGAANLARRVIASVASGDPVTAAGRPFPPRVVGAVAGAQAGQQQVSFAKLMKDAARALEQARKDGADLAVQP